MLVGVGSRNPPLHLLISTDIIQMLLAIFECIKTAFSIIGHLNEASTGKTTINGIISVRRVTLLILALVLVYYTRSGASRPNISLVHLLEVDLLRMPLLIILIVHAFHAALLQAVL